MNQPQTAGRPEPHDPLYGESEITFLEAVWGEGYLSPGGPEEVDRTLRGVDLTGLDVLDIGCGAGGVTVDLVRRHGAGHVIGIDVEYLVCEHARRRVERHGLTNRIQIMRVEPGPVPFDDGSFDVVFSKDSIVHIADKEALAADVFRVLRPGGWLVVSDWLIAHDGDPSPSMAAYLAAEDLDFGMASPARYRAALVDAGFVDIELVDRNAWYRDVARDELDRLTGTDRTRLEALVGGPELERQIAVWEAMVPVLDSGEHRPHHIRARHPD